MGRVIRLRVEAAGAGGGKGRGMRDEGGVVEGQTATKQLLGSTGLPCVIYCSTG